MIQEKDYNNKQHLFYRLKEEILAHEDTRKQAQETRFELLLELKGRDDVIDLLNDQILSLIKKNKE